MILTTLSTALNLNCWCVDSPGRRASHWAAYGGQLRCLQLLRQHNCDLHAQDKENSSVLHLAAAYGDVMVVRWLVEAGVSCNVRDHRNMLPKDVAKERDLYHVYQYLKQHTAKRIGGAESVSSLLM